MSKILEQVKNLLLTRKQSYQFTFDGVHGQKVLKDLAAFCRANKSTFHNDERVHAVLEGRREVWLRIESYLELNPDELWELYRKE